ncbi:hypothetical protein EV714DRAFT_268241 [Schizophyllum commune]
MSSIPSESVSTCQNLRSLPIVNHRIIALDKGEYRRQKEHFEYHWGMQKGELDLSSPLNHILLREDMVAALKDLEWTLMPTKEVLDTMYEMAEYNKIADVRSRKHFLKELPEGEYEYNIVPLYYLKHRTTLYADLGDRVKAYRTPYKTLPRIRSRAHPFFVAFFTDCQLDKCAAIVMPENKARALMRSVGRITWCWWNEPPQEFLVGDENMWKAHRHPLSDDGHEARLLFPGTHGGGANKGPRARQTTRAPSRQDRSAIVASKPYARVDPHSLRDRGSALPRPGRVSGDQDEKPEDLDRRQATIRAWSAGLSPDSAGACSTPSEDHVPRDDNITCDGMLDLYRLEPPRAARDALDPDNSNFCSSGLICGDGVDYSGYSSNNWAKRIYNKCLMNRDPICVS